jgi:membrane associated rhomboid family serine protease
MEQKLTKTFLSKIPSHHSMLVAALSLMVLVLFFSSDHQNFSANGFLVFEKKEYWRVFTTTLLHADLNHLAHNAFFFTGLSALLHSYFGLWVFPFLSLVVGGLINLVALRIYPPETHLVGISGVVYFMAAFWLTLYILIERRQKLRVRFIHAAAVSLIFFFPETFQERVSYLAHGLGYLFGVPMALTYYIVNRQEIRAQDQWRELPVEDDEMNNTILLDENSYHLEQSEADVLSPPASDSVQSPRH